MAIDHDMAIDKKRNKKKRNSNIKPFELPQELELFQELTIKLIIDHAVLNVWIHSCSFWLPPYWSM